MGFVRFLGFLGWELGRSYHVEAHLALSAALEPLFHAAEAAFDTLQELHIRHVLNLAV